MECMDIKSKFLDLKSREDVADILGIKDKSLRYFLYGIKPDNMYHEFSIPKKSGGERKICSPNRKLKNIQKKLADILVCVYKVKSAAHGFINNRSIVTNACKHKNKKYVLNLDLEDFFSQIHFGRVMGMLMKPPYGIGREAALVISQLVCYNGHLPQGAPTSPILTNMICSSLDTQLSKLAKKYRLTYTRYADDITFSSYKENFPSEVAYKDDSGLHVGNELEKILQANGFPINYKKVRMFDYKKRQIVTGLVVNKFVNLPREYIKEIRAILYDCEKNGIIEAARKFALKGKCKNPNILNIIYTNGQDDEIKSWFLQVLKGKVEYIRSIKGPNNFTFIKYAKKLNEVWGQDIFKVDEYSILMERIEKSVFILESNSKSKYIQGTGFLIKGKGLFTNYHVVEDGSFYYVKTYKGERINTISITEGFSFLKGSKEIDYAQFNINKYDQYAWEVGNSDELKFGDKLIVIGFPDYIEGNTPDVQEASYTSKRKWMNENLYTIDKRLVHGSSGGVVLNKKNKKVVGIIKCGAATLEETAENATQGFIPINEVFGDMESH